MEKSYKMPQISFTKGQEILGGNCGVFNSHKKTMQEKICRSSKIKKKNASNHIKGLTTNLLFVP